MESKEKSESSILQLPVVYITTRFIKVNDRREASIKLPEIPGEPDKFLGKDVWLLPLCNTRLITELEKAPLVKPVKAIGSEGMTRVTFSGLPDELLGKLVLVVVPNA